MTKSLTIINTSNWDGEDYAVVLENKTNNHTTCHILKPCDKVVVLPSQEIKATYSISKEEQSKPFKDEDGHQVLPYVDVEMRRPNQKPSEGEEFIFRN